MRSRVKRLPWCIFFLHFQMVTWNESFSRRLFPHKLHWGHLWKVFHLFLSIQKCEFKFSSYEFRSTSCEFQSMSCEFESMSYESKSTSDEPKSTSSRIIKSTKTQVNSLEISSFPKILNLKSFDNWWDNLYAQFLVIIFCFTVSLFHGKGFSKKQSE